MNFYTIQPPPGTVGPVPLVVIALIVAALAILASLWRAGKRLLAKHGLHALAWRYVTGAHMTAGGTHACLPGPPCRAGRWSHRPRHHRAALRLAVPATLAVTLAGLAVNLAATLAALSAAVAAGITWAVIALRRQHAGRHHERNVTVPLTASLARLFDVPELEARRLVSLPAESMKRTRGELGAVALPRGYAASPDQRKAVDHLITTHLPADVDTTWKTSGAARRVIISAAPSPPDLVPLASVAHLIEALNPGQVLLGLDRKGEPYVGDFGGGDDPHWGFSVGSGRGKSAQLCSIGAQILRQDPGASMLGIDPKMTSFEALAGVPGVELANDPRDLPAMWAAIARYKARMETRIKEKKDDPTAEFPVSLLFLDEINQFAAMSAAWWKDQGEKGTPPVWMDIAAVFWMGRFVHCHAVAVGQRLDDKATGGIGLRDSLGLRGLAGYRPNQWMMLIGTKPVPKSQKPRGRWIYSDGQEETWVQNVLMTPQEARDWACAGRRAVPGPVPVATGTVVPSSIDAGTGTGTPGAWVTGIEAAARHLGITAEAFKKRRQRAGGTIPGEYRRANAPAWTIADLDSWAAVDHEAAIPAGRAAE